MKATLITLLGALGIYRRQTREFDKHYTEKAQSNSRILEEEGKRCTVLKVPLLREEEEPYIPKEKDKRESNQREKRKRKDDPTQGRDSVKVVKGK